MQAVTLRLPIERVVGGALAAGDTVGVLLSFAQQDSHPAQTQLAYNNVLVVAVQMSTGAPAQDTATSPSPSTSSGSGLNSSTKNAGATGDYLVTLARPAADVEHLVYAIDFGRVYLSKEPGGTPQGTSSNPVDRTSVFQ
jgi:pilus assembly protein CpaB